MIKTEVKCDTCNRDLSSTDNCEDYRIVLANQSIPSVGGCVTLMNITPPLHGTAHFCGIRCLKAFVEKL